MADSTMANSTMNIVFVTTRLPYPPKEGHQLRTYNLLKIVARKHNVHLLSFIRGDDDHNGVEHLKTLCKSVELFLIPMEQQRWRLWLALLLSSFVQIPFVVQKYTAEPLHRRIKELLTQLQIPILHLDMLPLAGCLDFVTGDHVLLNAHNVESLLIERRAASAKNPLEALFFKLQTDKLTRFEKQACSRVDHIICCSEFDKKTLSRMTRQTPITVVPNGVDAAEVALPSDRPFQENEAVFVGSGNWFPNRDGVHFFVQEILPILVKTIPNFTLKVVGTSESYTIPERWRKNVITTGFVDDIAEAVSSAAVYVVPLRLGSGTRLKLLEAMAMGIPVVSTAVGCEGIAVVHRKHLLIADTPQQFCDAIVTLFRDRCLATELAEQAQRLMQERYDWKVIENDLQGVYIPRG